MTTNERTAFKRMHFFDGFFTTAEDWQADQRYHLDKRRLHNRYLHTPGILPGEGEELKVVASEAGPLFQTDPPRKGRRARGYRYGLAPGRPSTAKATWYVWRHGRSATSRRCRPLPRKWFISACISLRLRPTCRRTPKTRTTAVHGIEEQAIIQASTQKPDGVQTLELARINLQEDATAILDPADPDAPKANEIDRRYAMKAGGVDWRFGDLLGRLQKSYHTRLAQQWQHNRGLFDARRPARGARRTAPNPSAA